MSLAVGPLGLSLPRVYCESVDAGDIVGELLASAYHSFSSTGNAHPCFLGIRGNTLVYRFDKHPDKGMEYQKIQAAVA